MSQDSKDRYNALQNQLNDIQEQRKQEWEAFAKNPSQPLPPEPDCDAVHEESTTLMTTLEDRGIEVDEDLAPAPHAAPETTNKWYG